MTSGKCSRYLALGGEGCPAVGHKEGRSPRQAGRSGQAKIRRISIEEEAEADPDFLGRQTFPRRVVDGEAGAGRGRQVAEVEITVTHVDHPSRIDPIGDSGHRGPGKIRPAIGHRVIERQRGIFVVAAAQIGDAGTGADIGREADPGA